MSILCVRDIRGYIHRRRSTRHGRGLPSSIPRTRDTNVIHFALQPPPHAASGFVKKKTTYNRFERRKSNDLYQEIPQVSQFDLLAISSAENGFGPCHPKDPHNTDCLQKKIIIKNPEITSKNVTL